MDGTGIKTLGVAAIGYAFMGKAHSNAWRNVASFFDVPAFEQKVLVGRNPEQVAAAAARYGWSESATDWRSVLERDDIHVVDICAPGWMHAEIAIAALEAGKHVLVENPWRTPSPWLVSSSPRASSGPSGTCGPRTCRTG